MNANGHIQVQEGAKSSIDLATLRADGYTGHFNHLGQELPNIAVIFSRGRPWISVPAAFLVRRKLHIPLDAY
jgi:hypothetical protein